MKKIIPLAAIAVLAGCTDPQNSTRVVEAQGYTDVRPTGYRFLGCGRGDSVRTGFTATAPNGAQVTGVVCAGWSLFGKSYTVRID